MESDCIGIAGIGLLGRGIASCLLAHGFRVTVYDSAGAQTYAAARAYIEKAIAELIDRAGFAESLRQDWHARFEEAGSLREFAQCGFVIESVFEDFALKQQVYDALEASVGAEVPIASNASALPITRLQEPRRHPQRFLGMHWAEPAYVTRFLELIRGDGTSDEALNAASTIGHRCGKEPCVVRRDVPGFLVNRLGYAMYREAVHMLEAGIADVETIDRAFRNACGLWASLCGPFRWMDITGGPALYAKAMRGVLPTLSNANELPDTLEKKLADGSSFYTYEAADRERWQAILHRQAWAIRELQDEMSRALQIEQSET